MPKLRFLNRLLYSATLTRIARSTFPGLKGMLKHARQLNLRPAPKLPTDLRADLLKLYREDILRLQELLDRDLSRLAQRQLGEHHRRAAKSVPRLERG